MLSSNVAADQISTDQSRIITWAAFGYGGFVLYGSLVPFEIRPLGVLLAWNQFLEIPFLNLGVGARADWVANILLYIPLAFLGCAAASGHSGRRWRKVMLVLLLCLTFAISIEFFQQWFAPRTVSQNDILAEALGSVAGLLIWLVAGRHLVELAVAISRGGQAGLGAIFSAYCGLYLIYSFVPFDFLISGQELEAKLASEALAPIIVSSCGGVLRCSLSLALEVVAFIPLGIFLALRIKRCGQTVRIVRMAGAGLFLGAVAGVAIEGAQIFVASGVTQGISVGSRAVGMMAGMMIGTAWSANWMTAFLPVARRLVIMGLVGYLLLYTALIFKGGWNPSDAGDRFQELNWVPFYYHYYSTEQAALISLVRNAVLYAPLGLAVWTWKFADVYGRRTDLPGAAVVFWLGSLCALLMETSRLFKPEGHADPTNILIGGASAWFSFRLASWFAACLQERDPAALRPSFIR